MSNPITPAIVVAHTQCPRKAFLLLCAEDRGTPHDYERILERQQHQVRTDYLNSLDQMGTELTSSAETLPPAGQGLLVAATLKAKDLEAYCDVLTPVLRGGSARRQMYEPTLVVGSHTITQEHRLALAFIGYVLGQLQPAAPAAGTVIGMGEQVCRVPLKKLYGRLDPIVKDLRAWASASFADARPVILNRHCPLCPFRAECASQAQHDDDLSLLEPMPPRAWQRYRDRGIFTVQQLSYVYRPRRQRKPSQRVSVRHQPELQALALRTGKTYVHELPSLTRSQIELFLDIEGVPDRHAYYLFGLLVRRDGITNYHAFWADADEDEERAWRELLAALDAYPDAPVYHYGRYDPRAISTLAKRYHTDCENFARRLVNLNTCVYGKVYFPVRSNRLKEIGPVVGASWTSPEASGLQSLVWRHHWEGTGDDAYKELLLAYNKEDCEALEKLADALSRLDATAATEPTVDFARRPKRHATSTGEQIHQQFETMLRSAHARYARAKISLRHDRKKATNTEHRRRGLPGHQRHGRIVPKARTVVEVPQRSHCPKCGSGPLRPTDKVAETTIVDLVFTDSGCRKTVKRYVGVRGYCRQCWHDYPPATIGAFGQRAFGHGFQAWVVYQRVVLRLPYGAITQALEDQFGERISEASIVNFLKDLAHRYAETENRCRERLLASRFIHVDETKINIQGANWYVWVFTDGRHVLFRLTETREAAVVQAMLAGYEGILVADFYAGYDAVNCRQQRCLVHLIRDLNEDLWRSPFDAEFEDFVLEVKNVLVPIMEAVGKYGLKNRHLAKFRKLVDRFYARVITDRAYRSDLTRTYQKRFRRYRHSLFTFLEHDGIPWNNNMAERAIRHLAVQQKISETFFASVSPQYLLLLGLAQTCRFQDKSFLGFLLSGETEIDTYKASKRMKQSTAKAASANVHQ